MRKRIFTMDRRQKDFILAWYGKLFEYILELRRLRPLTHIPPLKERYERIKQHVKQILEALPEGVSNV